MSTERDRDRPGSRRRWLAVILATVIMLMSYVMFLFAAAALVNEENIFAGGVLGIALGLVPAVFMVASFVSQSPNTIRAALAASGLWLVVTVPFAFLDVATALVAGFGAGGVVAFRREPGHSWRARAVAVAACVLYTYILVRVSPQFGLFGGAALPFLAIAAADSFMERSAGR